MTDVKVIREALDLLVKGLADYVEHNLKLPLEKIYKEDPRNDKFYQQHGGRLQYCIDTYKEYGTAHYWSSIFGEFSHNYNGTNPLTKHKIWVEIPTGKYKGTIGYLSRSAVIANNEEASIVKGLRLLPNYTGAAKLVVTKRVIKDIFDQTIEDGDKVIFAERGKLRIGVLSEYDFHKNIAVINTPDGKEEINPRTSQIVNCQKINESFIANKVLTAMLKRD